MSSLKNVSNFYIKAGEAVEQKQQVAKNFQLMFNHQNILLGKSKSLHPVQNKPKWQGKNVLRN